MKQSQVLYGTRMDVVKTLVVGLYIKLQYEDYFDSFPDISLQRWLEQHPPYDGKRAAEKAGELKEL